jgi:hypothetical protein
MGVLTDIVVVDSEQAEDVLNAQVPSESFPGFDAKGLDQIKLASLRAILTNEDYDAAWAEHIPLVAGEDNSEGPWVYELPEDIVATLADLPEADEPRVAADWAATDELADWSPELVRDMLHELARCARRAALANKRLLMWVCL